MSLKANGIEYKDEGDMAKALEITLSIIIFSSVHLLIQEPFWNKIAYPACISHFRGEQMILVVSPYSFKDSMYTV